MKSKPLAAWHAVLLNVAVLTFGLLLLPMIAYSGVKTGNAIAKAALISNDDFIE